MYGWMEGQMEAKAGLRIAYSNQKDNIRPVVEWFHLNKNGFGPVYKKTRPVLDGFYEIIQDGVQIVLFK